MNIKKLLTSLLLAIFLLTQNFAVNLAYALPDLPAMPTEAVQAGAPSSPDNSDTPDQPSNSDTPDEPENTEHNEEATDEQDEPASAEASDEAKDDYDNNEAPQAPEAPEADGDDNDNTGHVDNSGEVGNVEISTGDAVAAGTINNLGNVNIASDNGSGVGGISIANEGNGTNSDNNGTVSIDEIDTTIQDNNADLDNGLNVLSNSGRNDASANVGNSSIESGEANTSGTILNSVNTNLEGAIVSEFNVVDDQVGDLILDYAANCIAGCEAFGGINVLNEGNGSDSTNTGEADLTNDSLTFQNNDADIDNSLVLEANTGENNANDNTGGNTEIRTGDANVSGNVLNFLNNNIAGNVIYGVVNIFGELIGDIIVPEGYVDTNLAFPVNVENTGNGSGSTNTGEIALLTDDQVIQFNNADIVNNLMLDANTGDNATSDNTGGNNNITTGDVDVDAQILNIANNNFVGGDWWIVLVNDAGNWLGKIFAPQGALNGGNFAMSAGQASTNDNGDINVSNNKNGSDSTNTGSVTDSQSSTTVQTNDADIVNNISLTANTGDNSASRNTGGNSDITTGDANIQFNLVNFLNNNFAGGNVFLTVVNVFGDWVGDFFTPGTQALAENNNQPAVGGSTESSNQNSNNTSSNSSNSSSSSNTSATSSTSTPNPTVLAISTYKSHNAGNKLASISSGVSDQNELALANPFEPKVEATTKEKTRINLAWGLVVLPGLFILNFLRRRFLA